MVREGVRAGRHEEVRGERRQAWLVEERRKVCESWRRGDILGCSRSNDWWSNQLKKEVRKLLQ